MSETDSNSKFPEGVSALRALVEAGAARILFGPYGGTQIELLETEPAFAATIAEHGLDSDQLAGFASTAADVLFAILQGASRDSFVRFSEDAEGEHPGIPAEHAGAMWDVVQRELVTPSVASRQWLKRTAHELVISSFRWDVWLKHATDRGIAPHGPVAGASITLSAASGDYDEPEESVVVVVDEDDIDYLVDSLARLKDALRAMRTESQG